MRLSLKQLNEIYEETQSLEVTDLRWNGRESNQQSDSLSKRYYLDLELEKYRVRIYKYVYLHLVTFSIRIIDVGEGKPLHPTLSREFKQRKKDYITLLKSKFKHTPLNQSA